MSKWINGREFDSYSNSVLLEQEKKLNILPIRLKFVHNSLTLFYKIVNKLVCIPLPNYLSLVEANTMKYTRTTASVIEGIDTSTYKCSVIPHCDSFRNSFFFRSMILWNALPVGVRQSDRISTFKSKLDDFLLRANTNWPD